MRTSPHSLQKALEMNPGLLSLNQILCHKITFHLVWIFRFTCTETPAPNLHRNKTESEGMKQVSDHFPD